MTNPGRVAGQPLRRSGRNAHAVFELRLAGLTGVGQDGGVDMDYHLVALPGGARIDAVVERGLGEQREGVGLLLRHRRCVSLWRLLASPLVEGLPRGIECLHEHGANLRGESSPDLHHTVFVLIHMQRPADVLASGLLSFGLGVHAPPSSHDALDMLGGAGAPHGEQLLLGLGYSHAGQLAGVAGREPHAPGEPGGTGSKAVVPAGASIELPDEVEKASGGGIEVRRELGDLVANPVEIGGGSVRCADVHGESPFCWGDSTPKFFCHRRGATGRDREAVRVFLGATCEATATRLSATLGLVLSVAGGLAPWCADTPVKRENNDTGSYQVARLKRSNRSARKSRLGLRWAARGTCMRRFWKPWSPCRSIGPSISWSTSRRTLTSR